MNGPIKIAAAGIALAVLSAACAPIDPQPGTGTKVESPHKRHNDWARFGRPDVGGARANDK